jgi:type IV pilus assembly protein PilA
MIELMIVVAIIGILAAIALPQFQRYTIRSRVSEGLEIAGAAKIAVAENANTGAASLGSGFAGLTTDSASVLAGSPAVIPATGEITIAYRTNVAPAGVNTLVLVPSSANAALVAGTPPLDSITWDCYAAGVAARAGRPAPTVAATLDPFLAPATCR